jgi:flavocytochrome c
MGSESGKKACIVKVVGTLVASVFLACVTSSTLLAASYKADVVIVGAGGAGLAAAIEAASRGASVIVAELDSTYGGTAASSGGGCIAVGTPLQREKGYEDSPDLAFKDWVHWGRGEADEQWARYYIERSGKDVYEWLQNLGVVWVDVNFTEGNTVPRFHRPQGVGRSLAMRLYEGADKGVEAWLFDTEIDTILKREGRVVGVSGANRKTGEKVELYGKALVMATGGFGGSREAVQHYAPRLNRYRFYVAGNRNCTGAGHRMIEEVGGYLTHVDNVWIYAYTTPDYEDPRGERGLAVRFFPRSSAIWVNAQGKRFHNEDLSGGATGTPAMLSQNPPFVWSVSDATVEEEMMVADPSYRAKSGRQSKEKKLKLLNESPFIVKAGSLRELALKMTVDPDILAATVGRYNDFVKMGVDLELGRDVQGLKKIEKPPFYAMQFFPSVRKTLGGVKTNIKCQVLDKHFAPIPGLYAAGELAGMAGGHIQGAGALEANLGASIFSGRVAGAWAAREAGKGKGF